MAARGTGQGFPQSRAAPLLLAASLALAALGTGLMAGQDTAAAWQLAARYTARASFLVFVVLYTAPALVRLWPGTWSRALLRRRRQWGLGFALAHSIHLGALAWYNIVILNLPGLTSLAGGGLAYALMFAMAATSNDASMRALGRWWKILHRTGLHWIWFVFTISYTKRLFDPALWPQGAALLPVCLAMLAVRLWAGRIRRTPPMVPA